MVELLSVHVPLQQPRVCRFGSITLCRSLSEAHLQYLLQPWFCILLIPKQRCALNTHMFLPLIIVIAYLWQHIMANFLPNQVWKRKSLCVYRWLSYAISSNSNIFSMNDLIQGNIKYAYVWKSNYSAEKCYFIAALFSWPLYSVHLNILKGAFCTWWRGDAFSEVHGHQMPCPSRKYELSVQDRSQAILTSEFILLYHVTSGLELRPVWGLLFCCHRIKQRICIHSEGPTSQKQGVDT